MTPRFMSILFIVIALILNFRGEFVLKNLLHKEDYSNDDLLKLKLAALVCAVLAFITVFRV